MDDIVVRNSSQWEGVDEMIALLYDTCPKIVAVISWTNGCTCTGYREIAYIILLPINFARIGSSASVSREVSVATLASQSRDGAR